MLAKPDKEVHVLACDISSSKHVQSANPVTRELRHFLSALGDAIVAGGRAFVTRLGNQQFVSRLHFDLAVETRLALFEGGDNCADEIYKFLDYYDPEKMLVAFERRRQNGSYQKDPFGVVSIFGNNHLMTILKEAVGEVPGVYFGEVGMTFPDLGNWGARLALIQGASILEVHLNLCLLPEYLDAVIVGVRSALEASPGRQLEAVVTGCVNARGSPSRVMPEVDHGWLYPELAKGALRDQLKRPIQSFHHQNTILGRHWVSEQERAVELRELLAYTEGLARARGLMLVPRVRATLALARQLEDDIKAAAAAKAKAKAAEVAAAEAAATAKATTTTADAPAIVFDPVDLSMPLSEQMEVVAGLISSLDSLLADCIDPPVMTAKCTSGALLAGPADRGTGGWNPVPYGPMVIAERQRSPELFAAAARAAADPAFADALRMASEPGEVELPAEPFTPPPKSGSTQSRLRELRRLSSEIYDQFANCETALREGAAKPTSDDAISRERRVMSELARVCDSRFWLTCSAVELIGCHGRSDAAQLRQAAREAVNSRWPLPPCASQDLWWLIDGMALLAQKRGIDLETLLAKPASGEPLL